MKKLITFLIVLLIPIFVFAIDNVDNNILNTVRNTLNLSDEYSLESSKALDNGHSFAFFGEGNNINVVCDKEAKIISFSLKNNDIKNNIANSLPNINKSTATQSATAFAVRVANDIIGQLDISRSVNIYSNGEYNIRFSRYMGGIKYPSDFIVITIDGTTGSVIRYLRNFDENTQFTNLDNIMDLKFAQQKYIENIGLELRYNKKVVNKNIVPYLVYVPAKSGVLDAVSGNAYLTATNINSNNYFDTNEMYKKDVGEDAKNLIDSNLITSYQALSYVRDIPQFNIDNSFIIQSVHYYINLNNDVLIEMKFIRKNGDFINITINAKNKDVIFFEKSDSNVNSKDKDIANEQKIMSNTNTYMQKYMKAYLSDLSSPKVQVSGDKSFVLFERNVNAIPYKSNGIHLSLDKYGDIVSVSFAWDKAQFPSTDGVLSKALIYQNFFNNVGFDVIYYKISGNKVTPVYTTNQLSTAIIDAKTGNMLSYDGNLQPKPKQLAYTDLDRHYSKRQATVLANCDIFVSSGNVQLADEISQKDFILLIANLAPEINPIIDKLSVVTEEQLNMLYNSFVTNGIMDRSEIAPNQMVRRVDAVKYFIRVLGYKGVADLQGIYKNSFTDIDDVSSELRGYVALARGLKLISGSDGYFMPNEYISNGDSLIMVYNYMNRGVKW